MVRDLGNMDKVMSSNLIATDISRKKEEVKSRNNDNDTENNMFHLLGNESPIHIIF